MFGFEHWYNFSHNVNEPQRPLTPNKVELHQHPKEERACVRQKKTGGRDRKEGVGWAGSNKLAPAEPVKRRPSPAPAKVSHHLLQTFWPSAEALFGLQTFVMPAGVSVEVSVVDFHWLH